MIMMFMKILPIFIDMHISYYRIYHCIPDMSLSSAFRSPFWPQKLGRSKVGPVQRGHLENTCDTSGVGIWELIKNSLKVLNYVFPSSFHMMFNFI